MARCRTLPVRFDHVLQRRKGKRLLTMAFFGTVVT